MVEVSAEPNPFFEPAPVLAAAELLHDGAAAAVIVVEDGSDLLFVLPVLCRRFRRVPVPALVSWQHPYCFSGTPLVCRGREHEAWTAVLDHLSQGSQQPWLVLEQLALDGDCAVALRDRAVGRVARPVVLDAFGRPVLRRRPERTYLDGRISSRHLKALRRKRRRLAEKLGGELEVVDVARGGDVTAGMEDLLRLELTGWKGRVGTAMASRPNDAAWFRRFCASMMERDRLQLWSLRAGGRAAAWQCNVVAGDTVFHFKIAYDENLARFSPGLQLEVAMIEEFHRDLRLAWVDSCGDADNRVSAQLYSDRKVLGTLAVPLRAPTGPLAVSAAVLATRVRTVRAALRPVVQRTGRSTSASPDPPAARTERGHG